METAGRRMESPIENIGRTTRRSRTNKGIATKLSGTKDQENVNNTTLVQNNVETNLQDEVTTKATTLDEKLHTTSNSLNSSTPRRKKDPLANLHSNLSPKYIGFSTPTHQLNSSTEETTRNLRKRHNNNNSANETNEDNTDCMEVDIKFTPNTESTVGFIRRTPRYRDTELTPENNIKRKKFVSPIDKLLIKNGAVMEFNNNNLPLIYQDEVKLKSEEVFTNGENKDEKELGVKKLNDCDENSENNENHSSSFQNNKVVDDSDENCENSEIQLNSIQANKKLDDCDENCKNSEIQSNSVQDKKKLDDCDENCENSEVQSNSIQDKKKLDDCDENCESSEIQSNSLNNSDDENNEIQSSSFKNDKEFDECSENSKNSENQTNSLQNHKAFDNCDENSENDEIQSISLKNDKVLNDCNQNGENDEVLSNSSKKDKELDECDENSENGESHSSFSQNDKMLDDCNANFEDNKTPSSSFKYDQELENCTEMSEINITQSSFPKKDIDKGDHKELEASATIEIDDDEIVSDKEPDNFNDEFISAETSSIMSVDNDSEDNISISTEIAEQLDVDDDENENHEPFEADLQFNADEDTEKAESVIDLDVNVKITDDMLKENRKELLTDLDTQEQARDKELVDDEPNYKQKTSDNETAEILKVIEQSKGSVIKVELENENINDFVDDPPSVVSSDSAKGSSINNDGSWSSFCTGDLYWGQIYNFCYWPCIVCPDPVGKITTEETQRSGEQTVSVHVRFFADSGRRNWVKRENLIPFVGLKSYQESIDEVREKYGAKSAKYKLYVPTKAREKVWFVAVEEANIVAELAYADRLKKFFEIFEKSKAFNKVEKQRRKSMYISVNSGTGGSDVESFYGSNDNINSMSLTAALKYKRERSMSPYSPAYSPIKSLAAKRRKVSFDPDSNTDTFRKSLVNNFEESPTNAALVLSQTDSVATTNSNTNDLDLYNSLEFRKLYSFMKDYVMEQNQDDKLEKSLVVAVRNIWALRQLNRQQMERKMRNSLMESDIKPALELNNSRMGGEGSAKRLSSRLKTLMVRKSLMAQQSHNSTPEKSDTSQLVKKETTVEKISKPRNRPILEVIDDIFDLDTKYLFKGMCREPVCKYCFKPGNLRKCAKNCSHWLHEPCLYIDFDQKISNKHKAKKGAKVNNNNNDSLNGSQSSSLVSLTEVGNANHVTSDTEIPVVSVGADVICKECSNNEPPKCMVCACTESKKPDDLLVKCSMTQCERLFHPNCCKYWPQAKITISKNVIESFRCPSHVCHTCVSDDPKGKFQHLNNSKLIKCVKCPATFHTDSTCIPAGSQILTAAHIICSRHSTSKLDMTINVNWCFICVGGGQLTCCETCPTAIHAHCLKIPIAANEGYICEECESGRMPLYGEMVWAKFRNFRWWPAIILPPTEIPKNIGRKTHNPSDFVVRFFGTHDHGWISRRRVYLYVEGDSSQPPKSKSGLDLSYNRGVEEAKEIYEIIKAKKIQQRNSNENKEKLHPQPYVRIKTNRPVSPVKLHIDIEKVNKCECDAREENPCGPDTNCLNRVLYHECNPKICPAGERCQNQMFESRVSPRLDVVFMKERGFGLVCREPIKAGSFVIEYVGEIINDDEFQARMQQKSLDRDQNFYFLSVDKGLIIDAGPKGNLARFMNHSCDPNCETQKWCVNSLNRVGLFAIRDIPENTELTFNYHWDDLLSNKKKTCYCSAKNCAGVIGAKIKDMETIKTPSTVIETGKKLLKTKKPNIKSKLNKKLLNNRDIKNKLATKLKAKAKTKTTTTTTTTTKTKKKTTSVGIGKYLLSNAPSTSEASTEEYDNNEEAASTSRLLQSPDIFN